MLLDPKSLEQTLSRLEEIEKASLRLVTQAVLDFRETAAEIFAKEPDLVQDFGEDITREALDRMGVSRIDQRLFGKIDYKRARYVFHPEYAIRRALFVDSKAEKVAGASTATLQTAQTSLRMRHVRTNQPVDEEGKLPRILESPQGDFLTTTIFVKYNYRIVDLTGGGADEGRKKTKTRKRAAQVLNPRGQTSSPVLPSPRSRMGCFRTYTTHRVLTRSGALAGMHQPSARHSVFDSYCPC